MRRMEAWCGGCNHLIDANEIRCAEQHIARHAGDGAAAEHAVLAAPNDAPPPMMSMASASCFVAWGLRDNLGAALDGPLCLAAGPLRRCRGSGLSARPWMKHTQSHAHLVVSG